MKRKVTNSVAFLLVALCFCSCVSQKWKYATTTELFDAKDSAQSLRKIEEIKKLDYSDFKEGTFSNDTISLNYRFLKPQKIESDKKYPLILVFHGSGAIGINNTSQMGVLAKMWLLPKNRENHPVFVLSPQFPIRSSNYHLDESRNVKVSKSNDYLDLVLKSVDGLIKKENIDPNRIYVMGFSMGGATTSNAISKRPDLFAAAINIAGISQFDKMSELKSLPIWIVHGNLDTDNFPQSNYRFYDEMKSDGKVFLWKYMDKYHNNILSNEFVEELPEWLFKQKKN